jgi:glycosyltransferase involved in cell wall biosynthesis
VLHVLVSTGLGGGPKHVFDLVRRLPRPEFRPIVAAPADGPYFQRLRERGIEVVELDAHRLHPWPLMSVVRLVRERGIQLVHSHGKGGGLYGRLAGWWTGVPTIHTFHGVHVEGYRPPVRRLYVALERVLGRSSRAVIALSEAQRTELIHLGFAPPDRCVVVPNGIDLDELDSALRVPHRRSVFGAQPDELIIGCVARFDPVKRLDVLLEATARLRQRFPRIRLVLVGGGPLESTLRQRVAQLGIDEHVSLQAGFPEALRCYSAWDVYATMSSREGLPYAVLEAMAAGLTVVASDVPGHQEVIRHGLTGFLVPATAETAAAAIQQILEDHVLRKTVGAAARRAVERDFTVDGMVERIADLYRQLAKASRPGG